MEIDSKCERAPQSLTEQQMDTLLRKIDKGESYRQISNGMGISIRVISQYKQNVDNYGTMYTLQEDLATKTGKKNKNQKK